MALPRHQLNEEYDEKLNAIQRYTAASTKNQALKNAIDFFLKKNKRSITYIPKTLEDRFTSLTDEIELLKEEIEDLKLKSFE